MGNGNHIRAVDEHEIEGAQERPSSEETRPRDGDPNEAEHSDEFFVEHIATQASRKWMLPAAMIVLITAWTALFGWTIHREVLGGASLDRWIAWAGAWSLPVILILAIWLLILRTSTREAARFGDAAAALARESDHLEARLLVVNRELSLAREFLASETRALETLGRTAAGRLSEHAERLNDLVVDNGERLEAIAGVSSIARDNMERLRNDLPVIANSAKDVANQIASVGDRANESLEALAVGFDRLDAAGRASDERTSHVRSVIDETLAEYQLTTERLSELAEARFTALRENGAGFRAELDAHEVEVLAAQERRFAKMRDEAAANSAQIRAGEEEAISAWEGQVEAMHERLASAVAEIARIDEQALDASNDKLAALVSEAEQVDRTLAERDRQFAEKLDERQTRLEEISQAAMARLETWMTEFDELLELRRNSQIAHVEAIEGSGAGLRSEFERIGETIGAIANQTRDAENGIARSSEQFAAALSSNREPLEQAAHTLSELTDMSVRLLELIRASAKHGREDIPPAIGDLEVRLAMAKDRVDDLRDRMQDTSASGERLAETVESATAMSRDAGEKLDELTGRIVESTDRQSETLAGLRELLATFDRENRVAADTMRDELGAALTEVADRARAALSEIESEQDVRLRTLADGIASRSGEAIDRALDRKLDEVMSGFEEGARRAAEASHEAAVQMRDQLTRVNELTSNLESRIAHARAQAQEQTDNDFSRRVALISESLNSNAIDIGKALSTEVTDTAWTSYLRGDRGIFTRRAVRLIDNTELREIADLFDADPDFREHVSRYIHDFEAMLRTLLSTRDGNVLGVTVLSSDMGKLYVVLAQAIQRLRE
ncbi:ATPase [Qipengyuania spongiae]|uniref:ATPase n=1 Tax=Qipengyuania spongiae TaxID=2909673 RepID=A0ABY5T0U2_9SPHN|nr:ATPase [Qipengyuania spongiae]UVI38941.1 ATPase [Qipengyuania spongiae]